jgi:hypothetical protein
VVKNFITRLKKDDLAHVIWDKEMVEWLVKIII